MSRRPQLVAAVALVILVLAALSYLHVDVREFIVTLAQSCLDVLKLMRDFVLNLFRQT